MLLSLLNGCNYCCCYYNYCYYCRDVEKGPAFSHSQNITLQGTDNELEEIHEIDDKSSNVSQIQEMENDIFEQQPVEVKIKKDKSNKESLGKYVIPVKRKKHKV